MRPVYLEVLLSKGVSLYDRDSRGHTPLHMAAMTGRAHNVQLILEHIGKDESVDFKTFVNLKTRQSMSPAHLAAEKGHLDVLKVLTVLHSL